MGETHTVTERIDLDGGAARLVATAALASAVDPTDPMDRAVRQLAEAYPDREPAASGTLLATHPLRPGRLAVIHVHELGEDRSLFAAKGAPEAIFELCRCMDAETRAWMHALVSDLAEKGLRVLGVASATHGGPSTTDPETVHYHFAGLIAFLDPLRADVPQALAEARRAGIGVAGAGLLEGLLGLPVVLMREAGLILVPFVAFVAWWAGTTRASVSRGAVAAIIAVNVLWVVASICLLIGNWVAPTMLGYAFVIAQAAAVGLFGELQYIGLKRQDAVAA